MKFIDVSVPLASALAIMSATTPFQVEASKQLAARASADVSPLHLGARTGTRNDAGAEDIRDRRETRTSRLRAFPADHEDGEEFRAAGAPAHRILPGAGTIIIDGLNLRDVEPGGYELHCLPLRVVGADGAPARVVSRQS